jgi:hypothetical protein
MEVDESAPAPTGADASGEASSAAQPKKFSPPLDGVSQDLIPEGVAYLRLLLILMNLDAGKVKEVSAAYPPCQWSADNLGWRVCLRVDGDMRQGQPPDA